MIQTQWAIVKNEYLRHKNHVLEDFYFNYLFSFLNLLAALCSMWNPSFGRIEPTPPALEARSLNTEPPGKSLRSILKM